MSLEIDANEDKCLCKAKFQNHQFFGNMVFGDIGKLNVITGPNGVGKSRLLNEMKTELSKEIWRSNQNQNSHKNIYPVHWINTQFTFNADSVRATFNKDDGYNTKVYEQKKSHEEYKESCNLLNDNFAYDREIF